MLSAPPFIAAAGFTFGVRPPTSRRSLELFLINSLCSQIAYMSDMVRKRGMFVGINCTVCLAGTLIMALTGPIGIRYFGVRFYIFLLVLFPSRSASCTDFATFQTGLPRDLRGSEQRSPDHLLPLQQRPISHQACRPLCPHHRFRR